jgi:hypothetical protein
LAAGISAYAENLSEAIAIPFYVGVVLAILHIIATSGAAPINFKQWQLADDEAALAEVFNKFEKWQAIRCVLQVMAF